MEIIILILACTFATLLYFAVGIILLRLLVHFGKIYTRDEDDFFAIFFAVFWPILLCIFIIIIPIHWLNTLAKKIK